MIYTVCSYDFKDVKAWIHLTTDERCSSSIIRKWFLSSRRGSISVAQWLEWSHRSSVGCGFDPLLGLKNHFLSIELEDRSSIVRPILITFRRLSLVIEYFSFETHKHSNIFFTRNINLSVIECKCHNILWTSWYPPKYPKILINQFCVMTWKLKMTKS